MKTIVSVIFLLAAACICASETYNEKIHLKLQVARAEQKFEQLVSRRLGDNGGIKCAACVIIVRVIEQIILYQEPNIEKALHKLCDMLPPEIKTPCNLAVTLYAKKLIELLEQKQNPDVVCMELNFCKDKKCKLYPKSEYGHGYKLSEPGVEELKATLEALSQHPSDWKDIFKRIYDVFDSHIPAFDFDNDRFATTFTLRGAAWRGRDCDDTKKNIYPGRKSSTYPVDVDHNCNGIRGRNSDGRSYEDVLCNVTQRGIIALGDSACAHFRIPEQWVNPKTINKESFRPLLQVLENEMDWPHIGWMTGFLKNDSTKLTPGPIDSIYMRMKERNHCVHRDYQALCVNGARTGAMRTIAKTISRNSTTDHPAIVFYALVGNDVCTPHPSTGHFTKPEEFERNVLQTMEFLDTTLAPDSYVVFIGLAEGGILYDTLYNKTHPLGTSYKNMYDFLNCYEINPCWGWMNSNETIRKLTSEHAKKLSSVYNKIIAEHKFKNFKMIYRDFPLDKALDDYKKGGGKVQDLIEPMDGFHPSQLANALIAGYMWDDLNKSYPDMFGPVNPNNALITKLFGDQGGY